MHSVLTVGFLIVLTLLAKALLLDNDTPRQRSQLVEPLR